MRNLDKGVVELFHKEKIVRIVGVVSKYYCCCIQEEWDGLLQYLEENRK